MAQRQLPSGQFLDESSGGSFQLPLGGHVSVAIGGTTTTIIVPLGSLVLAGFSPTVAILSNEVISVLSGSLSLVGYAPNVRIVINVTVPAGSLVVSGHSPFLSIPITISVPKGALSILGRAPVVRTTAVLPAAIAFDDVGVDVRCALVEIDRRVEVSGAPSTDTVRVSDAGYYDPVNGHSYPPAVLEIGDYSRSISGTKIGAYTSSFGVIVVSNSDGEYDFLLSSAVDGSQVRVYCGFTTQNFDQFVHMFSATVVKIGSSATDRIEIELKDVLAVLDKSIGGDVLVGGTGPNSDKARPLNFGYVRQVEFLAIDTAAKLWAHSDTGANASAGVVRDRGASVVFTDNADGTVTLAQDPDGTVTGDVTALPSDATAGDFTARRVSDAFREIVGNRCGAVASGQYYGPHYTFQVGDDEDPELGFSVQDQRKVPDLLGDIVDSGLCFWGSTRTNKFTFGRIRPNDVDSFGDPVAEIEDDDIDQESVKVDHATPTYGRYQAYMDKNWSSASNLALALSPQDVALLSRNGLYLVQDVSVGDAYADSPEKYDLTLTMSPAIETWLSGLTDEVDVGILAAWMEVRRFMYLPWLETVTVTVPIEFYYLELGDVVKLTMDRYGLNAGALFQVIGVNIQVTAGKVVLDLFRRRQSAATPVGWTRETEEDDSIEATPLITDFAVVPIAPPPPVPPPPGPTNNPWYPPNILGNLYGTSLWEFAIDDPYVDRITGTFADYVSGVPIQSFGQPESHSIAITADAAYIVVGCPTDVTGAPLPHNGIVSGIVHVLRRQDDGTYDEVVTITRPFNISLDGNTEGGTTGFGAVVDINDELDIFVGCSGNGVGSNPDQNNNYSNARIYKFTGNDTSDSWDSGTDLGFAGCQFAHFSKWNAAGSNWPTVKFLVVYEGSDPGSNALIPATQNVHIWRNAAEETGTWIDVQTLALNNQGGTIDGASDAAITFDGRSIAVLYGATNTDIGAFVELWQTNDGITWDSAQSFQYGTTDRFNDNGPIGVDALDTIAMSCDARVIAVASSYGTFRPPDNVYGAVYVYRAVGTASWPVVDTYQYKATILNENNNNDTATIVMSLDGQFIVLGYPIQGSIENGAVYGVNRVQSLAGDVDIDTYRYAYRFPNMGVTQAGENFGTALAMDLNGRRVVVLSTETSPTSDNKIRVLENGLNDRIAGITNDDWADAIDITPGTFVTDRKISPVKFFACSWEHKETRGSVGNNNVGGPSIWYKITPLVNALFFIDSLDSTTVLDPFFPSAAVLYPDTAISIFTPFPGGIGGPRVDNLMEIHANDDWGGPPTVRNGVSDAKLSQLKYVSLVAGQTYYIRVVPHAVTGVDIPLLKLKFSYKDADVFFLDTFTDIDNTPVDYHIADIDSP